MPFVGPAQLRPSDAARQIERAREEKDRAIEGEQFETAAHLRDRVRELTEQQRAQTIITAQALPAARRRLGLPTPPDPPATGG